MLKRLMHRKLTRACLLPLVWLAMLLIFLNALLAKADPLAFQVRLHFLEVVSQAEVTAEGYQIPAGRYMFEDLSITIQADGTRITPFTNPSADCRIVVLGDSVTFGYGVDDHETYVNRLALAFPEVAFLNTAQVGYNSPNIRAVYESSPADGYLYLIVDNDWHERWTPDAPPAEMPPVSFYAVWLWKQARGVEPVADVPDTAAIERFKRDTAPLFADNRVLIASYGKILFTAGLGVDVVAPITTTIAPGDMHPDAAGHERIADRLESQVRELVNRVCE